MELISIEQQLREENARLRELVERYHHQEAMRRLIDGRNVAEMGAWLVNGEKLQQEAGKVVPTLK